MSTERPVSHLPKEIGIGIDFGMTYSGAAVTFLAPGGVPYLETVPIKGEPTGKPKFPSVVYVSRDRATVDVGVGASNRNHSKSDHGKPYELFKHHLEVKWSDPDHIVKDARFLATAVLKSIKRDVDEFLRDRGFHDARVKKRYVFSYPGTWEDAQVQALQDAISAAGFTDRYMVDEAVATALGAAKAGGHPEILGKQEITFVCDFGGGTTDLALVQVTDTGLIRMSHAVGGNSQLGMANFDKIFALLAARKAKMLQPSGERILVDHIVLGSDLENAWREFGANAAWKSDLRKTCESAKHSAFQEWQYVRPEDKLFGVTLPDGQQPDFTKGDIQPFVDKALSILRHDVEAYLDEAQQLSGVSRTQVRYIVIGGGGSALPGIRNVLEQLMPEAKVLLIGMPLAAGLVQRGAACYGINPTIYDQRIAHSYGVKSYRPEKPAYDVPESEIREGETEDGTVAPHYPYYEVFLRRNDVIRPDPVRREFTPLRDNQDSIYLDVLNGDHKDPLQNTCIGAINLPLRANTSRTYRMTCTFTIGKDRLLAVSAVGEDGRRIEKPFHHKIELQLE